ncbi:MAG: hypothetical protein V4613_03155 [Bacteroidota bacterium]
MKENKFIRLIYAFLFFNNLIGIVCYPDLTLLSLVFIMGIPGVIAFIVYTYWYFKNIKINRILLVILALILAYYNYIIYEITIDEFGAEFSNNIIRKTLKAEYFPIINIFLNGFLAFASMIVCLKEAIREEPDTDEISA